MSKQLAHNAHIVLVGLIGLLFAGLLQAGDGGEKPYTVKDGKIDQDTYVGWRTYNGSCARCHAQDARGSTFAPSLYQRFEQKNFDENQAAFKAIVAGGFKGPMGVMPGFAEDPNTMNHVDKIWGYLVGLTNGDIPEGRPERIEE